MKEDYEELNRLLDDAINKVLIETTDRFNIPDGDPFKETPCDPSETPMSFESYDPDDMKHIDKMQVTSRPYYRAGDGPPPNVKYSYNTNDDEDEEQLRDFKSPRDKETYERPTIHNREKYADKVFQDSYGKYTKPSTNNSTAKKDSSYRDNENKPSSNKYDRDSSAFRYKTVGGKTYRVYDSPNGPIEIPVTVDTERAEATSSMTPERNTYRTPNEPYEEPRQTGGTYSYPESNQTVRSAPQPTIEEEINQVNDSKEVTAEKIEKLRNCLPHVIPRNEWGALPPMRDLKRMEAPAESFVFSLNTLTPECHEPKECVRRVRELQARHMGENLGDIQYNFLVGGDGNMYEGRGWLYESGLPKEQGEGINYNIAFIGNHEDTTKITPDMLGPVQDLVVHAKLNKLVVGSKVLKEIKSPKPK